jgi:phospholipid/cholesterol/gamma-HCH transport system substrate-binding protein
MMPRQRRTWWTDVLVAGFVAIVASTLLAGCGSGGYRLIAVFDDAGDLQSRGSVQIADVRVGSVGRIRLTKAFKAEVELRLRDNVKVPAGSTAVLRTTSLLGEKFVELRAAHTAAFRTGPFLHDGERVKTTEQAPELETVADSAIQLLGAIEATDIATLTDVGAEAFGPHSAELRTLIESLVTVSRSLADRTKQIGEIIDHLDGAATTLAGGADDLRSLLSNLSTTTQVLADNRERAVRALDQLGRLARVQNTVLNPYFANIDLQVKQVNGIVATVRQSQDALDAVLTWIDRFTSEVPLLIPEDFTQVYMRLVPFNTDACADRKTCGP